MIQWTWSEEFMPVLWAPGLAVFKPLPILFAFSHHGPPLLSLQCKTLTVLILHLFVASQYSTLAAVYQFNFKSARN